ncbi:hypothetical protein CFRS1_v014314 [Colletotrichum fructicola]|nr:hypothetical protein CFRS1_v014314 [Colletotrichum fructicola]
METLIRSLATSWSKPAILRRAGFEAIPAMALQPTEVAFVQGISAARWRPFVDLGIWSSLEDIAQTLQSWLCAQAFDDFVELANIEAKVILVVLVGRYDFVKQGLGSPILGANGDPLLDAKGRHITESDIYNSRQITAQPVDGMRVRAIRRTMY